MALCYTLNATIQFSTNGGHTMPQQINSLGQVVKVLADADYAAGTYNIDIYDDNLPSGAYFIRRCKWIIAEGAECG